ncbi:glycerol-3-phosphate responsive antiterminator [Caldalkalibacillus mannanilyticus]|uniref:glycerol-3-phosphate responsive antiterminator n=1 Tax=Caldalkalibacillus mannanilyticus TaxID=1418 RepID=UPI00046A27CD|nr:glycerol-3-phosphate responsive antiterminator [Caldalkalibacillus mannanilyticus]
MTNNERILNELKEQRMIAAIKDPKSLDKFLESNLKVSFLLTGNINVMKSYVSHLQKHDRIVFLHLEKIRGISSDREGLKFISNYVKPDGIISTKANIIKLAKILGIVTIQRLFLIDTEAVEKGMIEINENKPDIIEVLPALALVPPVMESIREQTNTPIITGGLLSNKEQMLQALENGAMCVSTGNSKLWNIRF